MMSLRIFLSLWLALTPAFAWAGSLPLLLGTGGVSAGGTPFSITEVSTNSSTTVTSSYTFTPQNIGTADPTRLVGVAITAEAGTGIPVISVTIGGISAAQVSGAAAQASSGPATDFWWLAVPTGITAAIVVTWSTTITRMAIVVYSIVGTGAAVSTGANTSSASAVSTLTQSAAIPSGGGAIGILNVHSATAGTMTPTNLTADTNIVFGSSVAQPGKNTSSSGSTSMGFSWAGTAADCTLSLVTFTP
jgi:hypothetical protein